MKQLFKDELQRIHIEVRMLEMRADTLRTMSRGARKVWEFREKLDELWAGLNKAHNSTARLLTMLENSEEISALGSMETDPEAVLEEKK